MCSHPVINSTTVAAADFHVKLGQASSFPQVGPRPGPMLQARMSMPMSARDSAHVRCFKPHTIRQFLCSLAVSVVTSTAKRL